MTKRRRINMPSKMLQAIRAGSGSGESVPAIAVASNDVVERMVHQLLPQRSWAKIFVAAINSGPVLIYNIDCNGDLLADCTRTVTGTQGGEKNGLVAKAGGMARSPDKKTYADVAAPVTGWQADADEAFGLSAPGSNNLLRRALGEIRWIGRLSIHGVLGFESSLYLRAVKLFCV